MPRGRGAQGCALLAGAVLAVSAAGGAAQGFPGKPIRLILPFPPGGASEAIARPVMQRVGTALGQSVVLDPRPGATGIIAAELAAKSPPDGYALLWATSALFSILPGLNPNLPYDPVKHYAPVTRFVTLSNALVVHPSLPVRQVKELIALARSRPGELAYASAGNGSTLHLAGELFKTMAKVDLTHVPYKGGAPAQVDLIAGHVQVSFDSLSTALVHIRSGRLRVLAVTTEQRSPVLPAVPTVAEAALPGFEVSGWFGVVAPAGTPSEIVNRLNAEMRKALASPDVNERLTSMGHVVSDNAPQEFAAFIARELGRYARIIREAGIRAD